MGNAIHLSQRLCDQTKLALFLYFVVVVVVVVVVKACCP